MNVSEELIREIVQKVLEESAAKQAPAEDFVKEKIQAVLLKLRPRLSNASALSRTASH